MNDPVEVVAVPAPGVHAARPVSDRRASAPGYGWGRSTSFGNADADGRAVRRAGAAL